MAGTMPSLYPTKITINKKWCKGCGICVSICPRKVLILDGVGKAAVADQSLCAGCGVCESHCPDFAISIGAD